MRSRKGFRTTRGSNQSWATVFGCAIDNTVQSRIQIYGAMHDDGNSILLFDRENCTEGRRIEEKRGQIGLDVLSIKVVCEETGKNNGK